MGGVVTKGSEIVQHGIDAALNEAVDVFLGKYPYTLTFR